MGDQGPITVLWRPSATSGTRSDGFLSEMEKFSEFDILRIGNKERELELLESRIAQPGVIVAAGGDGSVHRLANIFMQLQQAGHPVKASLGVFPLGTGNDFARSVGMPFEGPAAIQSLINGQDRPVDLLEFRSSEHSGWCVNMITGGNTGNYLDSLTDEVKERWGAFCYLRGIVDVMNHLETFDLEVSFDEGPVETFSALNVFIANGKTSGGGMIVSPDAEINDGLMDVIIVQDGTPGEIAGLTAKFFLSDYQSHELISYRRAKKLRLVSGSTLPLTSDGELVGAAPIDVTVRPAAISVRFPASS